MVLKADQERVRTLLTETITLLCKNGLHYQSEFSIEGLIAITVDNHEIFLVSLKETFHVPSNCESDLKIKQPDASPQVFHSNAPAKVQDEGKSSDSMEYSEILQAQSSGSTRCTKRGRRSASSLPDSQNQEESYYSDQKDLECISQTFMRPHCRSDGPPNLQLTSPGRSNSFSDSTLSLKPESFRIVCGESDKEQKPATSKDLSNEPSLVKDSPLAIREPDALETKPHLSHIKRELSEDEDGEREWIPVEPETCSTSRMDDLFSTKYSAPKLQGVAYVRSDTGIYQPSALRTTTMSLNMNTEPWPSGRRPPQRRPGNSGAKRHTCQMCNKSFTFASALTHHENNIHGRRPHPFKCFICGKGFWNQRSMRGHMTSKHLMQTEFCCPICHKEYAYKVSLRDHMKLYHNMTL